MGPPKEVNPSLRNAVSTASTGTQLADTFGGAGSVCGAMHSSRRGLPRGHLSNNDIEFR